MPRRRIGRGGLTEGETGELEEHHFDRDIAVAGGVVVEHACGTVSDRADYVSRLDAATSTIGAELEVALTEGADDAVFSGSTGIDRKRHTRTVLESVSEASVSAILLVPGRTVIDVAVERGVDAQITAELDAGVGAWNVVETGTIQGTDLHVLDRFGLDGKISCLCPTHGEETRR